MFRITGVVIYDNRMFESLANEPSVRTVMAALIKAHNSGVTSDARNTMAERLYINRVPITGGGAEFGINA